MNVSSNMAMVLQALKNAGLNDNQARILGAEIGRENAFKSEYLWGYHKDPKNKAINVGIISWQGARGRGVENALNNAGLIQNGKIVRGQSSLDVMAKYLVNEIRTNPAYAKTKQQFLDNPNVDYQTGNRVLGTNFIGWRYNDPAYASGHANRDKFYKQLGGIVPTGGQATIADNSYSQPQAGYSNSLFPTATPTTNDANPYNFLTSDNNQASVAQSDPLYSLLNNASNVISASSSLINGDISNLGLSDGIVPTTGQDYTNNLLSLIPEGFLK